MKKKSTLSLMELAVMVMIFALAAVLCLRAFVWADNNSRGGEERDRAALCAQSAAEVMKSFRGDADAVCKELGAECRGEIILVHYDSAWNVTSVPDTYELQIFRQDSGNALLGQADISVVSSDKAGKLFELTVCWQEVD